MPKVKIVVTKQDILKGKRLSVTSCPVALACHKTKAFFNYSVEGDFIYQRGSSLLKKEVPLPAKIQDWIESFDRGDTVKPITFYLEKPR